MKVRPIEFERKNNNMTNEPSCEILVHQKFVDWVEFDKRNIINGKIRYIFNLVLLERIVNPWSVNGIVVTANSSLLTKIIAPVAITRTGE